jgi:hypothetical protein
MRRAPGLLAAAVTAIALLVPVAGPASAAGPCDLPMTEDETVRHRMVRIIRCATARWPVRGGAERAICIADRESGLDPKARSPDRTYLGIYQHSAKEWPDRYQSWTLPSWELDDSALVGRTNIIVAIRMANVDGWDAWGVDGC